MKNLLSSATKIVLISLVFALIGLTAFRITDAETFKTAILMVLSFYFGQKSNPSTDNQVQ